MSDYFYLEDLSPDLIPIPADEAKHLVKSLRKSVGDEIHFTDGHGMLVTAVLESTDYENCIARVTGRKSDHNKRNYRLNIAIAPTKLADRFEWFVEKATEIGIDEITPIICSRSERKDLRTERLERIAVAAMKQSCQAYLPVIHQPVPFSKILLDQAAQKFICHLGNEPIQLAHCCEPVGAITVLIGPEGDFTPAELESAAIAGFKCVALGPTRLRTETAGMVACSVISQINL